MRIDSMSLLWVYILFLAVALLVFIRGLIYSKYLEAERRIPADEIELVDCTAHYPHAFSPRLTGKIRNKSTRYTLKTILLRINIFHSNTGGDGITLQTQQLIKVNIPPGKSDYLSEFIRITDKERFINKDKCFCEIIEGRGI